MGHLNEHMTLEFRYVIFWEDSDLLWKWMWKPQKCLKLIRYGES